MVCQTVDRGQSQKSGSVTEASFSGIVPGCVTEKHKGWEMTPSVSELISYNKGCRDGYCPFRPKAILWTTAAHLTGSKVNSIKFNDLFFGTICHDSTLGAKNVF